ncbi:MAG: PIN domain-containing protein [Nanoarchaeota archaeon]|nr:PIN domain-containing protein [Nanoarchaeota archaeon]MBU1270347.1 PIN domain-containing protein [Nanoarchaeota archaeon]MBU1604662.1 PIN domain-containing protein [Nanoarchaeota archaeon]MBU2443139.1 PIN domain-containing protein [Nanoarchaeota archaeon]
MDVVVDANILMSALIKDSHTRKLLVLSNNNFYTPEYVFDEINNHIDELEEKSGMPKELIKEVISEIIHLANVHIIPITELEKHYDKAKRITPDKDDTYYFALALKNNCPIWSNDKKLKTQNKITIYNTTEITEKHT